MLSLVAYNKRPRLSLNTLSSKYQKRENIVTTRIAAVLTMLQMYEHIYALWEWYSCSKEYEPAMDK
ncbi:hypothetical protein COOONC_23771 [Cooperia oncophora]